MVSDNAGLIEVDEDNGKFNKQNESTCTVKTLYPLIISNVYSLL